MQSVLAERAACCPLSCEHTSAEMPSSAAADRKWSCSGRDKAHSWALFSGSQGSAGAGHEALGMGSRGEVVPRFSPQGRFMEF